MIRLLNPTLRVSFFVYISEFRRFSGKVGESKTGRLPVFEKGDLNRKD